jgi:hypothetical protein
MQVTLTLTGATQAVALRDVGVFGMTFRSRNLLLQKSTDAGPERGALDKLGADGDDELADAVVSVKPPDVDFFMPNDVDLRARAVGAPPFKATIWPDVPFNGKVAGEEKTSWLGKPIAGQSTHATLTLKFSRAARMTAIAVYEDEAGADRYTDTYAVFLHEAKGDRWLKAGHVTGNRSPFNLFTFDAVDADRIVYLWLGSADGHARIAELAAYGTEEDAF